MMRGARKSWSVKNPLLHDKKFNEEKQKENQTWKNSKSSHHNDFAGHSGPLFGRYLKE